MSEPWAFGWTQLLTIAGFAVTVFLAVGGFNRWKREQIGARRLETAIEALSLAYESKYVFEHIRSPTVSSYEYNDMPRGKHESDNEWMHRGSFYATMKRISSTKDFWERAYKIQPKCMAMFGKEAEGIFLLMYSARREIKDSAEILAHEFTGYADLRNPHSKEVYDQLMCDIHDHGGVVSQKDRVGRKLSEFREKMEDMFQPVIGQGFKGDERGLLSKWRSSIRSRNGA